MGWRTISNEDIEWIHSKEATYVAFSFAGLASLISLIHVLRHLLQYTMPGIQIHVIRLILIVPGDLSFPRSLSSQLSL
jgi:hypothetical protein